MKKIIFACNYVLFLIKSKTKHDIHSPFVFQLLTQVIQSKEKISQYAGVESINYTPKLFSKSTQCGRLLFRLTKHFKFKNIIEIIPSSGIHSSYIATANQNSKIYALVKDKESSQIARIKIKSLELDNIQIISGNIEKNIDRILQKVKPVDLILINSGCNSMQTVNYFEKSLKYLHNESVFIINAIHQSKETEQAWIKIKKHRKVKVSLDLFFIGIIFFKKELTKENFLIRF